MKTGQQIMIDLIGNSSESLSITYNDMLTYYVMEFGGAWVKKELKEATIICLKSMSDVVDRLYPGRWLERMFDHADTLEEEEEEEALWIGTKQVTISQFRYYHKGLYFIAIYRLIIKNL